MVNHDGVVSAYLAWYQEQQAQQLAQGMKLKRGRLLGVQHTYAQEDRSDGCSTGNIILHEHALLSRQHAVMSDGHPPLLIQLLSLKCKVLSWLAS